MNLRASFGAEDRDVGPSTAQSVYDLFLSSFACRILENLARAKTYAELRPGGTIG